MQRLYYAVRKGRKLGIFHSWAECQKSVKGYSGAEFKKFESKSEALEFLSHPLQESFNELPVAFADGGSRKNPGIAGCGAVLYDEHNQKLDESHKYLGLCTNNQAEYHSLLLAIGLASSHKLKSLEVRMDSKLVVNQMLGNWRVNHENLKELHEKAKEEAKVFSEFKVTYIPRELNSEADQLANIAMDLSEKLLVK